MNLSTFIMNTLAVLNPHTGDNTSFPWLIIVCVVSLAAAVALIIFGKRKK